MMSKRPKILLMKRLLPLLLLLASSTTLAESGAYRVEVIVIRNLAVAAELQSTDELRSFSHNLELQETELPGDLRITTNNSNRMKDVWRRLRSSADYQPLVFTSWQQNRTDYFPPVRVHNEQVIDSQLRPPTHIMVADLSAQDPLAAYRSTFYQLDGSVQLKRSRFLHLFLDLEFRQGLQLTEPETMTNSSAIQGVFTLKQNRQIRTGRVQYFDTPFFGALIYVTAISAKPDS